jgi:predicted DNA-binding protein YlxM (UPF0122 family)
MPHLPDTAKKLKSNDHPGQLDKLIDKNLLTEIFRLRFKNKLTFKEIGKIYSVSPQAIHQRIKSVIKLLNNPDLDQAYADNRVDLLNSAERILLSTLIESDKLKDASLNNVAYSLKQIHDMRRINADLSTGNEAIKIEVVQFHSQPIGDNSSKDAPQ